MIQEKKSDAYSGLILIFVYPLLLILDILLFFWVMAHTTGGLMVMGIVITTLALIVLKICLCGFFMVNPNEGQVLQLFGAYKGTAYFPGLRWANPFFSKHAISVRVRNFETGRLKVNDKRGNPIDIAAVVVWKVIDSAEASFQVDNFENFVHVQSEAALRNLATGFPYDAHEEGEMTLTSHTAEISHKLMGEIQDRLIQAGVEVREARISHLAYASEIAATMLRRQQASAVIAARQKIVEGAVGMVETALDMLAQKKVIELDEDRRAAMVSNLLVVLCSEQTIQPVVNAGTLYQ